MEQKKIRLKNEQKEVRTRNYTEERSVPNRKRGKIDITQFVSEEELDARIVMEFSKDPSGCRL